MNEQNDTLRTKIMLKTNKTPILLFISILVTITFIDIIALLIFLFIDFLSLNIDGFVEFYTFEEHVFIVFILLQWFTFFFYFIKWLSEYYKIFDGKVMSKKGILFKKQAIFEIQKINTIEISQSFFGNLLNYGNVAFFYNQKKFTLKKVPYPEEFVNVIDMYKFYE